MRVNGRWELETDGEGRPLIRAKVENRVGDALEADFLLDTGADNTVLTAEVAEFLSLQLDTALHLSDVGGSVAAQGISVRLLLLTAACQSVTINLQCFAFSGPNALGTCALGRDVLNLFTVILDYNKRLVCLLAPNHTNVIQDP